MPYKYLEDGTPFVAKELNDRFDAEQANINDVTSSEIQHGGLGAAHLPMLIGKAGEGESSLPQKKNNTLEPFESTITFKNGDIITGATTTFDSLNLGRNGPERVSAILVLFNAHVEKFVAIDPQTNLPVDIHSTYRNEDVLQATFGVEVRSGSNVTLTKTMRGISPGYTMSDNDVYMTEGSAIVPDSQSNKDVAIRSVILPSDLDGDGLLDDINIRVYISEYLGTQTGTEYGVKISKVNLTCIPIQAKVVKS